MKHETTPYLSVVIPSYNEMSNIKRGVLDDVVSYLQQQMYTWEVVLTDDGSTDGTVDALRAFAVKHEQVRVVENIHAGKAPTVKSGMLAAKGQWRLFTDFDQSTPLPEVRKLFEFSQHGYDVVIGSREMVGARRDDEPFYRRIMGRGFNIMVQMLAVPGILDTQCGFKLLSAVAAEDLFNRLYIYGSQQERNDAFTGAFDVELLFLAYKSGYKIREVPIIWHHNATERVNPLKDSLRMFRDIVFIRLARIAGKYKK